MHRGDSYKKTLQIGASDRASGAAAAAKGLSPLPLRNRPDEASAATPSLSSSTMDPTTSRGARNPRRAPLTSKAPPSLRSPNEVDRTRRTVMDPLAALRRCLQYICSHPEVYGNDIRGLLDREVMHVVRLKASEMAMANTQRPLLVDPLQSSSVRQEMRLSPGLPPLPTIPASSTEQNTPFPDCAPAGDLFGYGAISFLPASSMGFNGLLRDARMEWLPFERFGSGGGDHNFHDTFSVSGAPSSAFAQTEGPLKETIQWGGTTPAYSSGTQKVLSVARMVRDDERARDCAATQETKEENMGALAHSAGADVSPRFMQSSYASESVEEPPSGHAVVALSTSGGMAGEVSLDQHGYEVTFLRTQLQQLEAAFNSKCVRLHELQVENLQFAEKVKASQEATARWSAQHHAMQGQLEVMRRELDGWKDRATDAVAAASKQSKQRSQHAKQIANSQLSDAKQEILRLGQLWRETERALQETRRSFENTEKEAIAAHNHLDDAFHYLERLERRVARRDAYVALCERRQRSLEEKYEKLRWGFEELCALVGRHSYVDYLLTTKPLWSVYLFLSLAQHMGDYVALENPAEVQQRLLMMVKPPGEEPLKERGLAASMDAVTAMEPLYGLLFSRSSNRGRLIASEYSFRLLHRTMVDEATAEISRRGRPKQLRTNLHGSVACRVIRWYERYTIDYLRGEDNEPYSSDLNRKCVPLLTLASVLLPLRSRAGEQLVRAVSIGTAAAVAGEGQADAPPPEDVVRADEERVQSLLSSIPNKRHFDEATIRFLMRCFWKERLASFAQQMYVRAAKNNSKGAPRSDPMDDQSVPSRFPAHAKDMLPFSEDEDLNSSEDDPGEDEDPVVIQTFLAALVDFSIRFAAEQSAADGSGTPPVPTKKAKGADPPSKATLLSVRGVLLRGSSTVKVSGRPLDSASHTAPRNTTGSFWDCGRIFFASVLQPDTVTSTDEVLPTASPPTDSSGATTIIADDARELLAGLYYYTMEYRDFDPDFRLFYLVSHQLIPEMVAINFFAGLDAFQNDCMALLESRVEFLTFRGRRTTASVPATLSTSASRVPKAVDDPLYSLTNALDVVDDALLDGEEEDVEPDSEGDGYGSIFSFHAKVETHAKPNVSNPSTEEWQAMNGREEKPDEGAPTLVAPVSRRAKELRLLHNIRVYLQDRRSSSQPEGKGGETTEHGVGIGARVGENSSVEPAERNPNAAQPTASRKSSARPKPFSFGTIPPEWTQLEEQMLECLGPHTALLDSLRDDCYQWGMGTGGGRAGARSPAKKDFGFLQRRRARRRERAEMAIDLGATRGLLNVLDILALIQRHCLATYAVSCCGTPRFSLLSPLFGRGEDAMAAAATRFDPHAIVGHMPLTGLHLQRLRFALSMDQPSHLIRTSTLFSVDPVTKANSHFYNAYLTIVLDVFQQQQAFLMQSVLRSCALRHEQYAAEGGEDCDGQIPIAWLRKGLTFAFSRVRGTAQHAEALVNHFVQYNELLRLEDEVKFEQFADAPLLINVPPSSERLLSSSNSEDRSLQSVSSPRRSVTDSFVDEAHGGNFNLHEEADSCSLLHVAFAVRMTYIVWGEVSAPTAEALVNQAVRRAVPMSCCDVCIDAEPFQRDATVFTEMPEWMRFDQVTRQQYMQRLERIQHGHNGDANPLRRMWAVAHAEEHPPGLTWGMQSRGRTSLASSHHTVDSRSLYPNMANVWVTEKVLAAGGEDLEAAANAVAAASTAPSGGADAVLNGAAAASKTKRKRQSSVATKALLQAASQAAANNVYDESLLRDDLPEYGLLSMTRALGYAPPSTTIIPNAAASAPPPKKGASKKTGKKGSTPKGAVLPDGAIPVLLQHEYSTRFTLQLQDLAAHVAALAPLEPSIDTRELPSNAVPTSRCQDTSQRTDVAEVRRATVLPEISSALQQTSSLPLHHRTSNARDREKTQLRATIDLSVPSASSSPPLPSADQGPLWSPIFPSGNPHFERAMDETSGTPMVVSKLYALCAAMNMM